MTNSFSILGYPIVPINDKILEYEALYNSFYMNSFPKEGSVEAFDNYNIVKFGDDAGRLPFHFYNMNDMTANVITNNNFSINIKSKYNSLNIINAFINIDNAKNSILSINIYDDEENNIYYKQIDLSDINYTKAGFISIKLENLDIKIGSNYKIEFSLKPSNLDEFITTRLNQEGNIIMAVY